MAFSLSMNNMTMPLPIHYCVHEWDWKSQVECEKGSENVKTFLSRLSRLHLASRCSGQESKPMFIKHFIICFLQVYNATYNLHTGT